MDSRSRAAVTSTDPRVQAALQEYFARVDRGERIDLEPFLAQLKALDDLVKSFAPLHIN